VATQALKLLAFVRLGHGQVRELRGGRRAGAVQARFALWLLDVLTHAIEPQQVDVDIQAERAAEALDQRHCTALRVGAVNAL